MRQINWRRVIGGVGLGVALGGLGGWYATQPVQWQVAQTERVTVDTVKQPVPLIIVDDPQYLIMNFAPMSLFNWAAPEEEWQSTIKLKVLAEVKKLKTSLPAGSPQRRLAWSTLMEYMNFPLDTPDENSPYVVRVKRIFEITREENIPVFVPLNGFQWWDELPELYNWWDADGTHTDPKFFARQRNPVDFKKRFIAGYDPANAASVEWQDWQTPMGLNWRNWGGGGFRLAPPPNLVDHQQLNRRGLNYRKVQRERYQAIVQEIVRQVRQLEAAGKSDLFAGISIGTEVSLNASATPKDEFEPYGYRAMKDLILRSAVLQGSNGESEASPSAAVQAEVAAQLATVKKDVLAQQQLRQQAVREYLTDLSWLATRLGLPMQRIYTHVWSEAVMGEPRYVDYAAAAYNPYSRPGISLYGYAPKPFDLPVWQKALTVAGMPAWGAVEFSIPKTEPEASTAMAKTALSTDTDRPAAKTLIFYNWEEHNNAVNLAALTKALTAPITDPECSVAEIINPRVTHGAMVNGHYQEAALAVTWNWLEETTALPPETEVKVKFYPGTRLTNFSESLQPSASVIDPLTSDTALAVPSLKPGIYTWLVEAEACGGVIRRSQPQVMIISPQIDRAVPRWVQWWLRTFPRE